MNTILFTLILFTQTPDTTHPDSSWINQILTDYEESSFCHLEYQIVFTPTTPTDSTWLGRIELFVYLQSTLGHWEPMRVNPDTMSSDIPRFLIGSFSGKSFKAKPPSKKQDETPSK